MQGTQRRRLYCEVPLLSFDQESRRLQGSRHEKDRFLHQYQRQERHEVLSTRCRSEFTTRTASLPRKPRSSSASTQAELGRKGNKIRAARLKSSKPDYPDTQQYHKTSMISGTSIDDGRDCRAGVHFAVLCCFDTRIFVLCGHGGMVEQDPALVGSFSAEPKENSLELVVNLINLNYNVLVTASAKRQRMQS